MLLQCLITISDIFGGPPSKQLKRLLVVMITVKKKRKFNLFLIICESWQMRLTRGFNRQGEVFKKWSTL